MGTIKELDTADKTALHLAMDLLHGQTEEEEVLAESPFQILR